MLFITTHVIWTIVGHGQVKIQWKLLIIHCNRCISTEWQSYLCGCLNWTAPVILKWLLLTNVKQQAITCGCHSLFNPNLQLQCGSGTCKCTTNLLIYDGRHASYPTQLLSSVITTNYLVHGFTTTLISCCWELALKAHHTVASGFWLLVDIIDGQEGLGTVDWDKSSLTKILSLVIILPCFQRKETKRLLPKCKILPSVKVPYLVTCTLLCLQ